MSLEVLSKELKLLLKVHLDELFQNYTWDVRPVSSEENSYTSTLYRIHVTRETGTISLIVKVAPLNTQLRLILPIASLYAQEINYYRNVLRELENLQTEHGVLQPFRSYPKFYQASLQEFNEVLLLEDKSQLGFKVYDRLKTLDYAHAVLVIKEYAKLHALGYALKKLKPKVFARLQADTQEKVFLSQEYAQLTETFLKEKIEKASQCLDPIADETAYARFSSYATQLGARMKIAAKTESAGDYAVFTHSDCWITNYLFKYKDEVPEELCILDWQLAHAGSPALDLSYFIFFCTDQVFRQKHYEELIQEYYRTLSQFLDHFQCKASELLPFEVLQEHLKRLSVYGLYMAITVMNLDLAQGTPSSEILKLCNSRTRGIILDFINYGYDL